MIGIQAKFFTHFPAPLEANFEKVIFKNFAPYRMMTRPTIFFPFNR
jgi:hypothetical protein